MDRITKLCSYLSACKSFADVACDHGYCAEYMLKNNLCETAVITDISFKCLSKAEKLLKEYIALGKCRAVCCDGLASVDEGTEQVLIAGIGGDEIVRILENSFIPRNFVFQPMKNSAHLRRFLLSSGCKLTCDDMFTDGKNYYYVMKGSRGAAESDYGAVELEYGKDSLKNPVFYDFLNCELEKLNGYLIREMTAESRKNIVERIAFMQGALNREDR